MATLNVRFESLFFHERQALVEALIRDMNRESGKAAGTDEYAKGHGLNARMIRRIIEHLLMADEFTEKDDLKLTI